MHFLNYWAIFFIHGGLYFLRNIETQSVHSMNLGVIILLSNEHREYIQILFWSKAVLFFSIRNWDRRNIWRRKMIGHFLTAWRNYSYTWNWGWCLATPDFLEKHHSLCREQLNSFIWKHNIHYYNIIYSYTEI